MAQFYFLSIIFNVLLGLTLLAEYLGGKLEFFSPVRNILLKVGVKTVVVIVSVLVGIFKLIIKSPGETVPVAGDLLPAMTGIGIGGVLLFDIFRQWVKVPKASADNAMNAMMAYYTPLGIFAIVVAILHFIFPGVLIL